jgi:hypothetical protein
MGAIFRTPKRDAKSEGQQLAFTFCVAFSGPEDGTQKRATQISCLTFRGMAAAWVEEVIST